MIIKKITAPASKIFTIENVVKTDKRFSEIPHLDLSFKTLRSAEDSVFFNKEDRKGYGIYTITFNDEKNKPVLAYIGSFCGTKDVASERWEKHMGTLTCRSYKTNFKKYKSRSFKKLTLGDILKNKENYKEGLTKIIDEKKETLKNDMKEIKGSLFYNDVLAEIFKINFSSSEQKIKNLLGEGTSTSKWRMRFASDNWTSLKNKTKDNLLDCFTFTYYRIPKYLDFESLLNKKIKDAILANLIEYHLIEKYKPIANEPKPIKKLEALLKDLRTKQKIKLEEVPCELTVGKINKEVEAINQFIENDFI